MMVSSIVEMYCCQRAAIVALALLIGRLGSPCVRLVLCRSREPRDR